MCDLKDNYIRLNSPPQPIRKEILFIFMTYNKLGGWEIVLLISSTMTEIKYYEYFSLWFMRKKYGLYLQESLKHCFHYSWNRDRRIKQENDEAIRTGQKERHCESHSSKRWIDAGLFSMKERCCSPHIESFCTFRKMVVALLTHEEFDLRKSS